MISYKQSMILDNDNVFNIETEKLYRKAEDEFFFFNKPQRAIKLLKNALILTPCHTKCMKLIGDIYFTIGKIQLAFDYYSQAAALKSNDCAILASLAMICEVQGNYSVALGFINMAYENLKFEDYKIASSIYDFKVNILVKLQRYQEARSFLEMLKKRLPYDELGKISTINYETLHEKLLLKERMKNLNIKVV